MDFDLSTDDSNFTGLITELRINSGNGASKRKINDSIRKQYKYNMRPHSLNFSPTNCNETCKRTVLGAINSKMDDSININKVSKLNKMFEERKNFNRIEDKENESPKRDYMVEQNIICNSPLTYRRNLHWTLAKISSDSPDVSLETPKKILDVDSRDSGYGQSITKNNPLHSPYYDEQTIDYTSKFAHSVPDSDTSDIESLHDLEREFDSDIFDKCTKYEIISTDSPDIISAGRSTRKINTKNFNFGAPIADIENSKSFNVKNTSATRALNFDFTSPIDTNTRNVKKSLKFKSDITPTKSLSSISSNESPISRRCYKLYPSNSTTSVESGFSSEVEDSYIFDNFDIQSSDSPKNSDFINLISGEIKEEFLNKNDLEIKRPLFSRSLSLNQQTLESPTDKVCQSLLKSHLTSPENKRPFKRPEPPLNFECLLSKRRKNSHANDDVETFNRPILQRAFSENAASIMLAVSRSITEPDLIADFSKQYALPLISGRHEDLKTISSETLAELIEGQYSELVKSYKVIDCRYPYEYEGGHIKGALNLYTREQILRTLMLETNKPSVTDDRRTILVFHCEFSMERGPKLFRYLRSSDRAKNQDSYPRLNYPEIYLLNNGYKEFYTKYSHLCEPNNYTTMNDPKYDNHLKVFRQECQMSSVDVTSSTINTSRLRKCQSIDGRRQKSKSRLLL